MLKTVEGRSACKRSRPSDVVSRQIDSSEASASLTSLQAAYLAQRYNLSPATAAILVGHCFGVSDDWRARR